MISTQRQSCKHCFGLYSIVPFSENKTDILAAIHAHTVIEVRHRNQTTKFTSKGHWDTVDT